MKRWNSGFFFSLWNSDNERVPLVLLVLLEHFKWYIKLGRNLQFPFERRTHISIQVTDICLSNVIWRHICPCSSNQVPMPSLSKGVLCRMARVWRNSESLWALATPPLERTNSTKRSNPALSVLLVTMEHGVTSRAVDEGEWRLHTSGIFFDLFVVRLSVEVHPCKKVRIFLVLVLFRSTACLNSFSSV